jgi:hypothetical protein
MRQSTTLSAATHAATPAGVLMRLGLGLGLGAEVSADGLDPRLMAGIRPGCQPRFGDSGSLKT